MFKHRNCILTVVFILTTFLVPIPTSYSNHSWGKYHWARTSNSFTLLIGDNLKSTSTGTTPWTDLLKQTINDWNKNSNNPVRSSWTTGVAGSNCSAVQGTTQVCNKTYGNNGWLGLAQIWLSGSHIIQGTSKMNDTYFNTSSYNYNTEKLHVMCQEVAHTFGLGHQSTSGASLNTCMDYYYNISNTDTKSTKPNTHDFDELKTIYSHSDTTNTFATSTATAKATPNPADDPKYWGKLMNQSPDGRSSTYETYIGNGIRIVTHVTWTKEKAAKCGHCDHRFD